jgi:hypothetical protein
VTYFQIADEVLRNQPQGSYWREWDSVRAFAVLLAYMYGWTGSHVLSMKILLAVATVLYLLAAELFFSLFTTLRWQAVLVTVLSAFAVSFGFASWGVTDSTALLPRTLVAPFVMLSFWIWLRWFEHPAKYLVFPLLIVASLIHLSTFYVIGILGLWDAWDLIANRRFRIDRRVFASVGGLLLAALLLFAFERMNLSIKVIHAFVPNLFAQTKFAAAPPAPPVAAPPQPSAPATAAAPAAPAATAPAEVAASGAAPDAEEAPVALKPPTGGASAKEAWRLELSLRGWRNMPLPPTNIANVFASFALILCLALAGLYLSYRPGFAPLDRAMAVLFLIIPVFAFGPQTALWGLRSFTNIYPMTIEEVRAVSLVMIPALYFVLRLVQFIATQEAKPIWRRTALIAAGVVVLPLVLKSLPAAAREKVLDALVAVKAVDPSPASVNNARAALGLLHSTPFYYSTAEMIRWLEANTAPGSRILSDRDELVMLSPRWDIVGPRQIVGVPRTGFDSPEMTTAYFEVKDAIRAQDTRRMARLARKYGVDYFIVPWAVDGAVYGDRYFSVVKVR